MENVADSSQSRVKMVNNTIECDASTYSEADQHSDHCFDIFTFPESASRESLQNCRNGCRPFL